MNKQINLQTNMANLLIGSSNLDRHYKASDFTNIRKYKMLKCTKFEGYAAFMGGLVADNKNVLISVIENFIVDAVGNETAKPEVAIDDCIKKFLSTTLDAICKFPGTRFGLVMPLRRPAVPWYNDRVDFIAKFMGDGIKAMISERNVNNVSIINSISVASQQFERDQVHLTAPSASVFLEVILDAAEKFFDAPMVDLTDPAPTASTSLEDRMARLEDAMEYQFDKGISDNLMFARSREELDAASNRAKEDRIVINGLSAPLPLPTDPRQRIEALKGIASKIFEKIIPGFQGKITYLTQANQQQLAQQMIEVRLDSAENAIALRKAFADKRKKKELGADLDSLFMTNCVNLATRIRVDIMKAIARRLTNGTDLAYVAGFTSRPMMHIRAAGAPSANTRPLKSFTFIDSVSRFGKKVTKEDLETAYGRAGRSFNGQLQQNFVVLNERDQSLLQKVAQPRAGTSVARGGGAAGRARGTKRPGDDFESSNSKK